MTPADAARVLTVLRADLDAQGWDDATRLPVLAAIDQRLWNITTAADFAKRVEQQ